MYKHWQQLANHYKSTIEIKKKPFYYKNKVLLKFNKITKETILLPSSLFRQVQEILTTLWIDISRTFVCNGWDTCLYNNKIDSTST